MIGITLPVKAVRVRWSLALKAEGDDNLEQWSISLFRGYLGLISWD